jgi:hypothetical protein
MVRMLRSRLMNPPNIERPERPGPLNDVPAGHRRRVVRGGVEPPTFRFSGGRSYQLSYLTGARAAAQWLQPLRS